MPSHNPQAAPHKPGLGTVHALHPDYVHQLVPKGSRARPRSCPARWTQEAPGSTPVGNPLCTYSPGGAMIAAGDGG